MSITLYWWMIPAGCLLLAIGCTIKAAMSPSGDGMFAGLQEMLWGMAFIIAAIASLLTGFLR